MTNKFWSVYTILRCFEVAQGSGLRPCSEQSSSVQLETLSTTIVIVDFECSERELESILSLLPESLLHRALRIRNVREGEVSFVVEDQVKIEDVRDVIEKVEEYTLCADTLPDKVETNVSITELVKAELLEPICTKSIT